MTPGKKRSDVPRKILQRFSREKLAEFRHFTAKDRLAWLEGINRLYWAAREQSS